jgi:hypothetical protein
LLDDEEIDELEEELDELDDDLESYHGFGGMFSMTPTPSYFY